MIYILNLSDKFMIFGLQTTYSVGFCWLEDFVCWANFGW